MRKLFNSGFCLAAVFILLRWTLTPEFLLPVLAFAFGCGYQTLGHINLTKIICRWFYFLCPFITYEYVCRRFLWAIENAYIHSHCNMELVTVSPYQIVISSWFLRHLYSFLFVFSFHFWCVLPFYGQCTLNFEEIWLWAHKKKLGWLSYFCFWLISIDFMIEHHFIYTSKQNNSNLNKSNEKKRKKTVLTIEKHQFSSGTKPFDWTFHAFSTFVHCCYAIHCGSLIVNKQLVFFILI